MLQRHLSGVLSDLVGSVLRPDGTVQLSGEDGAEARGFFVAIAKATKGVRTKPSTLWPAVQPRPLAQPYLEIIHTTSLVHDILQRTCLDTSCPAAVVVYCE